MLRNLFKSREAKLKEERKALLRRAVMPTQIVSNVYISIDKASRIGAGSAWNDDHGDCVGLRWNPEGTKHWLVMDMSPARARLFALDILARCETLENVNGTASIDTPNTDFEAKLINEETA